MNTNGNVYTIIYSTVLVVLVAAILSIVAISLQPKQNENVKIETVSKVFTAATESYPQITAEDGSGVLAQYAEKITDAFYVDGNGTKVDEMNTGKDNLADIKVPTTSDLKRQNDLIKKIEAGNADLADLQLPVFVFNIEGDDIHVIPCYGAGLWGPIWGYIAVKSDGKTLAGAIFDHSSETPGLGAKIAEAPFYTKFIGKVFSSGDVKFDVVKGGDPNDPNSVDAITGASITSKALGKSINTWVTYYEPYLQTLGVSDACTTDCGSESAENNEEE